MPASAPGADRRRVEVFLLELPEIAVKLAVTDLVTIGEQGLQCVRERDG